MSVDLDCLSEEVITAASLKMPFGKFKGTRLIDLPEPYVVWFKQQGFPKGRLGQQMALIYEIKANGLEKLIRPLLEARPVSDAGNSVVEKPDKTAHSAESKRSDDEAP